MKEEIGRAEIKLIYFLFFIFISLGNFASTYALRMDLWAFVRLLSFLEKNNG